MRARWQGRKEKTVEEYEERKGRKVGELGRGGKGSSTAAVGTVVKADNTLSMFYEYKK